MKTINFLFTAVFLLLLGACTNENQPIEEDLALTRASSELGENNEMLFGAELYRRSTGVRLYELNQLQIELEEGLNSGEIEFSEEFENIQVEIEKLNVFEEYLRGIRPPRMPRPPGPKPPKGCFEENNCHPQINISTTQGIILSEEEGMEVQSIEIRNDGGELVGEGTEIYEDEFGNLVMAIEKDFSGEATMYIAVKTEIEDLGTVVSETRVLNEQ